MTNTNKRQGQIRTGVSASGRTTFSAPEYLYFVAGAVFLFLAGKTCAVYGEDYGVHIRIAESLNLKDPVGLIRSHSEFIWHVSARLIAALLRAVGLGERYGTGIVAFSAQLGNGMFVAVSFLLTCYFLHRAFPQLKAWLVALLGFSVHVASAVYLPGFSMTVYKGQSSFNPWHNPTIIALRPFMILFMCLLQDDLNRSRRSCFSKILSVRRVILLSALLLLTNMAKPCFAQCFLPAIFLLMILWLFRYRAQNLRLAFQMLLMCVPCALYILFQFLMSFGSGSGRGVQILPFVVAGHMTKCLPLSVLLLQAFPLTMLIIMCLKSRNPGKAVSFDAGHEISLLMWIFATAERMLLAETGGYLYHGNFGWAYSSASAWCLYVAVEDYAGLYLVPDHALSRKSAGFAISTALLALHVISGLYYIYWIAILGNSM